MKSIKIQIIVRSVFILIIITASCTEIVKDIQLDTTRPRLVVEGYISTDTTRHMVKLSKTGDALKKNPIQVISNALVTISDGAITYKLTEDQAQKGTYLTASGVYGITGRNYTLHIENVDINDDHVMEEYTAGSMLKKLNPIDSIFVVYDQSNPDLKRWIINLFMMDPGNGRNFYLFKIIKNNELITNRIYKYSIFDNHSFEGKYYDGFPVYNLMEDEEEERLAHGDTVTVEMYGITEDYYSFISSYIIDHYPKVPIFSGPSANIPSNIKPFDDAVGIFAAYSIQRKSIVYK